MNEEDKAKEFDEFLSLMYKELERTLIERPKNPVTAFAHKMLEKVNLGHDGEELPTKETGALDDNSSFGESDDYV